MLPKEKVIHLIHPSDKYIILIKNQDHVKLEVIDLKLEKLHLIMIFIKLLKKVDQEQDLIKDRFKIIIKIIILVLIME